MYPGTHYKLDKDIATFIYKRKVFGLFLLSKRSSKNLLYQHTAHTYHSEGQLHKVDDSGLGLAT